MENPRTKKRRREDTRSSWADLPLDIQVLILGKLNPVDVIRFPAVCKNWQIPGDRIIKYKHHLNNHLPWTCKLSWSDDNRLQCQIYDPHSRQIFNTWKSVENIRYTKNHASDKIRIGEYNSKQGWLIAGIRDEPWKSMFMYNPYSMKFISLPPLEYSPRVATFSGDPVSRDCQVFVHCLNYFNYDSYIYCCCLNVENQWRLGAAFIENNSFMCGLEYMNGQIFCLFRDGMTERYKVADGSWTLLDRVGGSDLRSVVNDRSRLWLTKGEGDLLMAVVWGHHKCLMTFYFDWSNTIWVQTDLPESSAIFISGSTKQATFVKPFVNCDVCDTKADCNFHFFDKFDSDNNGTKEPPHYSFAEMRKCFEVFCDAVFFIEPPRIIFNN